MAQEPIKQKKRFLSASSLKNLDTCSWLFWKSNIQKVPQKTNHGALRGSTVHSVFELLTNLRHKKHFVKIIAAQTIKASAAVNRFVIKEMKRYDIYNDENYQMVDEMIVVGLNHDFYGFGKVMSKPEYRFELENKDPHYSIRGFMDVYFTNPDGSIDIRDYKSSKQKFPASEIGTNIQAMMYTLVAFKELKATDVNTEFIFLRFPRSPVQKAHFTRRQIAGFEYFLSQQQKIVDELDEEKAKLNYAKNNVKTKWMCGAGPTWRCPYRDKFFYFSLINEDGTVARTALKKEDLKLQTGQRLVKMVSEGCPAWQIQENDDI